MKLEVYKVITDKVIVITITAARSNGASRKKLLIDQLPALLI